MRPHLCHVIWLLFYISGVIGKGMTEDEVDDYERQSKGLPPRQPKPISDASIQSLPAYKRVRVGAVHYDVLAPGNHVKEIAAELAAVKYNFQTRYRFEVYDITIPVTTSEHAQSYLQDRIRSLYQGFSGPDDLVIIWYGGHGGRGGTWTLLASSGPIVVDWQAIDSGVIAPTGVDTLQIIDSCYALGFIDSPTLRGTTAPAEWNGRGALSVLAAASGENEAGSCAHAFSKAVVYTLDPYEGAEAAHFTPYSLFHAIPVPGVGYATIMREPADVEASIRSWFGPKFFEFFTPESQTFARKIAPLPCNWNQQ